MKKFVSAGFALMFISGIALAEEYIPWTFDDFDANCEVIDNNKNTDDS